MAWILSSKLKINQFTLTLNINLFSLRGDQVPVPLYTHASGIDVKSMSDRTVLQYKHPVLDYPGPYITVLPVGITTRDNNSCSYET